MTRRNRVAEFFSSRRNAKSNRLATPRLGRNGRSLILEPLEQRRLLSAVVWTDKLDYAPAETARITAQDFTVGETIEFQILHTDGTPNTGGGHDPWYVTDGSANDLDGQLDGNVLTTWFVNPDDSGDSAFQLTATGQSSGSIATTEFTDELVGNRMVALDAWDLLSKPAPGWVKGNVGGYTEGEIVPFQATLSPTTPDDDAGTSLEFVIQLDVYNHNSGASGFSGLGQWDATYSPSTPDAGDINMSDPLIWSDGVTISGIDGPSYVVGTSEDYLEWTVHFTFDQDVIDAANDGDQKTSDEAYILYGGQLAQPGDTYVDSNGKTQTVARGLGAAAWGGSLQARAGDGSAGDKTVNFGQATIAAAEPAITIAKDASVPSVDAAGQDITYTYTVTNTGNSPLTGVEVTDDNFTAAIADDFSPTYVSGDDGDGFLEPAKPGQPAETWIYTYTYTVTQDDMDAGVPLVNTATVTCDQPVSATDDATVDVLQNPDIDLVKSWELTTDVTGTGDVAGEVSVGDTLTYSFLVTNTGNVTLNPVEVADLLVGLGEITGPDSALDPGASTTFTATYLVTLADVNAGEILNTATATGTDPNGEPTTDDGDATVDVPQHPDIDLVKSWELTTDVTGTGDVAGEVSVGDTLTYSFLVTNTGNVTLNPVEVADLLVGLGEITGPDSALDPGASTTFTATYLVTLADVNAGEILNTATATGTDPNGAPTTDDGDATVDVPQHPDIDLVKSWELTTDVTGTGDVAGEVSVGDTLTYSFLVTNTGNVTLNPVEVADLLVGLGEITGPDSALDPGASTTFTATYLVTLADVNAGEILNTATATGTDPNGEPTTDDGDATVDVPQHPDIDLVKSWELTTDVTGTGDVAGEVSVGDTLTYSFLVTNTGNVTLNPVEVADLLVGLGPIGGGVTSLDPGASTTFTATYLVTLADVNAGEILNTATATGTDPNGEPTTDDGDATVDVLQNPDIDLVKSWELTTDVTGTGDVAGEVSVGDTLTYSFLVTNTGNVTLNPVEVADLLVGLGEITGPDSALDPGASTTFTATYLVTLADVNAGEILNTATATGTDPNGEPTTDDGDATVDVPQHPDIDLVKSWELTTDVTGTGDVAGEVSVGDTLTYSFLVTNTGNVTLNPVEVADLLVGLGEITGPDSALDPGASTTFTATYLVTLADVNAGEILNTATATGTDPNGAPTTDDGDATVDVPQHPDIDLVKSWELTTDVTGTGDVAGEVSVGDTLTYSFLVTNTGNVTLNPVEVADLLVGLGEITGPDSALDPGASTTFTATYLVTLADVNAGEILNTATATGTDPNGEPTTDDGDATVDVPQHPDIDLVKSWELTTDVTGTGDVAGEVSVGDTLTYSFLVTNTGNVTLNPVEVADLLVGLGEITGPDSALDPGASTTFTATYLVTLADVNAGEILNTATATGTDPNGAPTTDDGDATVDVPQHPDIDLVKSWELTTDVTGTGDVAGEVSVGDTLTYSFLVTNTGNVTLNPVEVADLLVGLGPIGGGVTSLDPGASTTFTATYLVTLADVNAGEILNTATATGTDPNGEPTTDDGDATVDVPQHPDIDLVKSWELTTDVTGTGDVAGEVSVGDTLTYSFLVTNTGNVTLNPVEVADLLVGLGEITGPDSALDPGASTTFTATYLVTLADVNAGEILNTATATGTDPNGEPTTDDGDATVDVPQHPDIDLVKSWELTTDVTGTGDVVGEVSVGDTLTYSFLVTNTGNVTLNPVEVADLLVGLGEITGPDSALDPGASTTFTATYLVTLADVNAGEILNTATATGTDPNGEPTTDDGDATVDVPQHPDIDLVKSWELTTDVTGTGDVAGEVSVGDTLTYSFLVTNTGNVTLNPVEVADLLVGLGEITGPDSALDPGASTTFTATYLVTLADVNAGEILNTATATGTDPNGAPTTDDGDATVDVPQHPDIDLVKSWELTTDVTGTGDVAGEVSVGDTLTYSFLVTNTGNVTLNPVEVADLLVGLGPIGGGVTSLDPGASTTFTATYLVTLADVNAGEILNTATATGTDPNGEPTTDDGDATVDVPQHPDIDLVKSWELTTDVTGTGDVAGEVSVGDTLTYSFLVTNTGNVTLNPVEVADLLVGLGEITGPDSALDPGASTTFTATYLVTLADVNAGEILNTATATGTDPNGAPTTDDGDATVDVPQHPDIDLVKSWELTTDVTGTGDVVGEVSVGDTLTYSFLVTNTGNVTLNPVEVADLLVGLGPIGGGVTSLDPGASTTFTATYLVTLADVNAGEILNTATATGTDPNGEPTTDDGDATVDVPQHPDIDLVKSWELTTDVTGTGDVAGEVSVGDTLTYSFLVTNTGNVTLNPVEVADLLVGLGEITGPDSALDPGASTTFTATYLVTLADVNAGEILNTATATGTDPNGDQPTDDGDATVDVPQHPAITLVKTAVQIIDANGTESLVGDEVQYSFEVTNTGNVTLDSIVVKDLLPWVTRPAGGAFTLEPDESTEFFAYYEVTADDLGTTIENTAIAYGNPPGGDPGTEDDVWDDDTEYVDIPDPELELTKVAELTNDADGSGDASAGDTITYTYTVENTGAGDLTGVVVTDDNFTHGDTPPATDDDFEPVWDGEDIDKVGVLDVGETWTYSATYVVDTDDLGTELVNIATAISDQGVEDTDSASMDVPMPGWEIVKTADVAVVDEVGDLIAYTIIVTNTGEANLTLVEVNDALLSNLPLTLVSGDTDGDGILDAAVNGTPAESWTYQGTYMVTQEDLDRGYMENTALAVSEQADEVEDSVTVYVEQDREISILKEIVGLTETASPKSRQNDELDWANEVVNYEITVANTGNVTLRGVAVTDLLPDGTAGTISGPSGDSDNDGELDMTEQWIYTISYTVSQDDLDAGLPLVNTAKVVADDTIPKSDDAEIEVVWDPAMTVVKEADVAEVDEAGDVITYTITVTNTGNITLTGVNVIDDRHTPSDGSDDETLASNATLEVGEIASYIYTYTVSQADIDSGADLVNVATANSDQTEPTDGTDTVDVVQEPAIEIDKFLVSYENGGDLLRSDISEGDTLTYGFDVTNTGNVTLSDITVTDERLGGLILNRWSVEYVNGDEVSGDGYGELAPGETWRFEVEYLVLSTDVLDSTSIADYVYIENVGVVEGTPPMGDPVTDSDVLVVASGDGVGTPGYWKNHPEVWMDNDGVEGITEADVINIGDWNFDGVLDEGETWLTLTTTEAMEVLDASTNQGGGDKRFTLGRALIATWLNIEVANNAYDGVDVDGDDILDSLQDEIDDAIEWLVTFDRNVDGNPFNDEYDKRMRSEVRKGWRDGAELLYEALDEYNNTGAGFASDRDSGEVELDPEAIDAILAKMI